MSATMNKEDIDLLIEQIRSIILNKPLTDDLKSESEELADLQEAVFYLSNCLAEANEFLRHLRKGELDVPSPSRHNFLAGNLKELHSALKHLTWQANQVANGDYNQSVHFLGDFSSSFNQMIQQLAERESQLKIQSAILTETVDMMKSVMDGLNEWIVATTVDTGEVVYANRSARQFFFSAQEDQEMCGNCSELLDHIKQYKQQNSENSIFEYRCDKRNRIFRIRSYTVRWSEKLAYAHFITDITSEKEYREQIEELAYADPLTGLYNRRFFLDHLEELVGRQAEFSLCIIDLDGLKYANDNFGHAAGDAYLKAVAKQLLQNTRSTDMVCRIGGDEFAILLPNCRAQIVLDKMERVNQQLAEGAEQFPMSVSYGVTFVEAGTQNSSKALIDQADEKMYILKNMKKAARDGGGGLVMRFGWTRDLETGNPQIDAEHKQLIQAINRLLQACAAGNQGEALQETLSFLLQYTKTHFSHEEALQRQYHYPDYPNHLGYHQAFIPVVEEIAARLSAEGPTEQLVRELNQRLGGWLLNHIKTEDAKVAEHIRTWQAMEPS